MKWAERSLKSLKTNEEILNLVDVCLKREPYKILTTSLHYLDIPMEYHNQILTRWKHAGRPSLPDFAPYAAHVLRVDMFFMFLIARGLISDQGPTHRIDFFYFYYLPFTRIFTSNDKLHKEMAPLLLAEDQCFVEQAELKNDLALLAQYYDALPEEVISTGSMTYAEYPPRHGSFLVSRLYDQFHPGWRAYADRKPESRDPEREKEILERAQEIIGAIKAAEGTKAEES